MAILRIKRPFFHDAKAGWAGTLCVVSTVKSDPLDFLGGPTWDDSLCSSEQA